MARKKKGSILNRLGFTVSKEDKDILLIRGRLRVRPTKVMKDKTKYNRKHKHKGGNDGLPNLQRQYRRQ